LDMLRAVAITLSPRLRAASVRSRPNPALKKIAKGFYSRKAWTHVRGPGDEPHELLSGHPAVYLRTSAGKNEDDFRSIFKPSARVLVWFRSVLEPKKAGENVEAKLTKD
jgi:hypothetical protein